MPYDSRNLADTVYGGANRGKHRAPCPVPRPKGWPYTRIAQDEDDPEERQRILFDTAHTWSDRAGGLRGGTCTRCGKTLAEIMVPDEQPEPPPGSGAHLERALRSAA